jgi:hypothetical protein
MPKMITSMNDLYRGSVVRVSLMFALSLVPYLFFFSLFSASSNYVIIESQDGLSNRLRLLAGYLRVMQSSTSNFSSIVMVWDVNEACPGHFLEIFEPLKRVTFISRDEVRYLIPEALAVYPPSYMSYLEVLNRFHLHSPSDPPTEWHTSRLEIYSLYRVVPHLIREASLFVKQHNICASIGLHVRHTDLDKLLFDVHHSQTNDTVFHTFIDHYPSSVPIFLMTDNSRTQQEFIGRYAGRVIVYDVLKKDNESRKTSDIMHNNDRKDDQVTRLSSTPLHHQPPFPDQHTYTKTTTQLTRQRIRRRRLESKSKQKNDILSHHHHNVPSYAITSRELQTERHRSTSLSHTILEVLIASHCMAFQGTHESTLSELVFLMNRTESIHYDNTCLLF